MRSLVYATVQKIAHGMLADALARGELRGKSWQGRCVDCGTTSAWTWVDEHRDYSDPYDIVTVCASCNQKRGSAILMLFNVETAEWERVWPSYFTADVNVKHWTLDRLLKQGILQKSYLVCTPIQV